MGNDQNSNSYSRKEFLKRVGVGAAGITLGLSAKSYSNILGANDRVNFGIVGLHGRGQAHMSSVHGAPNCNIQYLCDVDSRVLSDAVSKAKEMTGSSVKTEGDVRKLVEKKDVDAISIATPDHWHTPMALLGVNAGKHVYVEKPCSHNPQEGEWLVQAQKKYSNLVMQMGDQQRSAPTSIEAVQDIRDGLIGRPYFGKAWYSNKRGPIGTGKHVPVPEWLDWELWQGPAPHEKYEDIWVHYNWHWFWNWGTGEINNNGIHELDFCRWALDAEYPTKVTSTGGRYHYHDDWQFYDTQVASYEFGDDKMITWEGKSCNPFQYHGRGRGATIHGTKGTILADRNGYIAYDLDNNVIKERKEGQQNATSTSNTIGGGNLSVLHFHNFAQAIRGIEEQHSPMTEAHKSNLLCHYGNIAQKKGRVLNIDQRDGKIKDDPDAMKMWSREYEDGWKPTV